MQMKPHVQRDTSLPEYVDALQQSGRYSFASPEVREVCGLSPVAFKQAARRLVLQSRLASPRCGFFVVVPLEYRSMGAPPPSWYVDALMRFHSRPYTGTGIPVVSTPEATAVDIVRNPHAAGGIGHVVTVFSELAERLAAGRLAQAAARQSLARLRERDDRGGRVIPRKHITAWRSVAPWSTDAQVEQDLVSSRAEFEANLDGKLADAAFHRDIRPLLAAPGVEADAFDIPATARTVLTQLIARLPGEPWRGRS